MLMTSKKSTLAALGLSVLLVSGVATMQVFADDGEHTGHERSEHSGRGERGEREGDEGNLRFSAANPNWQAECSACHIAYPPGLLPASAWREMMGTLGDHFGTDASLDEVTIAEILPFLEQNAAPEYRAESTPDGKPVLRITETRWFKHEHDEVSPAVWKRDSIKSASNCMACHTAADKGDFDEDNIRIPR